MVLKSRGLNPQSIDVRSSVGFIESSGIASEATSGVTKFKRWIRGNFARTPMIRHPAEFPSLHEAGAVSP